MSVISGLKINEPSEFSWQAKLQYAFEELVEWWKKIYILGEMELQTWPSPSEKQTYLEEVKKINTRIARIILKSGEFKIDQLYEIVVINQYLFGFGALLKAALKNWTSNVDPWAHAIFIHLDRWTRAIFIHLAADCTVFFYSAAKKHSSESSTEFNSIWLSYEYKEMVF